VGRARYLADFICEELPQHPDQQIRDCSNVASVTRLHKENTSALQGGGIPDSKWTVSVA
jgi:hypothetical protein